MSTKKDKNIWIIFGLTVVITASHYLTPTSLHHWHEVFRRLYYIPIILAAVRYGLKGGIIVSLSISLIYLPHVIFQWAGHGLHNLVRFMEVLLYLAIGVLTGFLTKRINKEKNRFKKTAEKLKISYGQLETKSNQLIEMESQLRSADRLAVLGELSASLAHEVRNPLGSIKGAVDIIAKQCRHDKTSLEFSKILQREVVRLNRVVDNYLNMTRKTSGESGQANVAEIVQLVVQLLEPEIKKRSIKITCDFPELPLLIPLSDIETQQVYLNLVLNAVSAIEKDGQVALRGNIENGLTRLIVQDNGKGILKESLNEIFRPFYSNRKNGTGLGLPIVKRIVESAGGTITVESEKNKGSSFVLTFEKQENK